jgi:asparaginyl-tRNA synthetase
MYDPQCIERVRGVVSEPFARCSYTEAVEILQKAIKEGKKFENMEVEFFFF